MPSMSYNGQSFSLDGRRLWILGASMQYARIPAPEWAARIRAARHAGFNTIETACPWFLHEPRRGRYSFQDETDVAAFVRLCAQEKLNVIVRAGPYVGSGFDGGGLPGWLREDPELVLREGNEPFLERVSRYFRKLLGELAGLQATQDGPIILVQVEHDWTCANDAQAERYLREVARVVRECGITVPLINANNLWTDPLGTIDVWRGDEDLLVNLRQLRAVQPGAPRMVSAFEAETQQAWGQTRRTGLAPDSTMRRVAEILAANAQPVVTPFHGGTNFGFLGGRLPGPEGGAVTTSAAAGAPLGEAGAQGETYRKLRRIVTFASQFGHVFADLDPDYQPVALDPREAEVLAGGPADGRSRSRRGAVVSVVPLRGGGGRVVFVFASGANASTTLLLDNGMRLPVSLGDQPVGWFILDADVRGRGRLDYANLCPLAIVDRSIVVLHGPARADAFVSVNGAPLHATVPSGAKPAVIDHKGITFVICNQQQIDVTCFDDRAVYVGADGFDAGGAPSRAPGWARGWSIDADGGLQARTFAAAGSTASGAGGGRHRRAPASIALRDWRGVAAEAYTAGASPRFASLSGPMTLAACGAAAGYGWYRLELKVAATRKRLVHLPQAGDRTHLYVDGQLAGIAGVGPGAAPAPLELSLAKGPHTVVALLDNLGRFADGNDLARRAGLYGHLYEAKPLRAVRPKLVTAKPADPFEIRAFIKGAARGQRSDDRQIEWTFSHARKTPLVVSVAGASPHGTLVLNGGPVAYYAGGTGAGCMHVMLDPSSTNGFKRGRNVLRFAPDVGQNGATDAIRAATTLYECVDTLTASAAWAFAKWEPPANSAFAPVPASVKRRGVPCWWRCAFPTVDAGRPLWFHAAGLSKGQLFVNGHNLGRYFTATATGRAVGPQERLYVPACRLRADEPNEILLFDEHGFAPHKTRMVFSETGDLD